MVVHTTQFVIPTGISAVSWCNPPTPDAFEPARISRFQGKGVSTPVAWLDVLLEGGLVLPGDAVPQSAPPTPKSKALSILLTGPPGTGKSLLATELCYRWAQNPTLRDAPNGLRCLYVTTEAPDDWVRANCNDLGWEPNPSTSPFKHVDNLQGPGTRGGVFLHSVKSRQDLLDVPDASLIQALDQLLFGKDANNPALKVRNLAYNHAPEVVVIDSLNSAPAEHRSALFEAFFGLVDSGPRILVIIMDSPSAAADHQVWEFLSDVVIRLDRFYEPGYMLRSIEIVKARYQRHAWGKHQLKIYENPAKLEASKPRAQTLPKSSEAKLKHLANRLRMHPYHSTGGIFIFPSIHFYLSKYKRDTHITSPGRMDSHLPGLNATLNGYPEGRCIAFLGSRGTHKSHLAYLEILHSISTNRKTGCLVVSLRDDEGITRLGMKKELQHVSARLKKPLQLARLETSGQLEIMYFPPGAITAEEFFHRVLLSINRLKQAHEKIIFLFNSADQLQSRFPLCAREDMFIPGLAQMLSAEDVTSFFVSAHDTAREETYYGLESIAELIIDFRHRRVPREKYQLACDAYRSLEGSFDPALSPEGAQVDAKQHTVCVKVVRFAGGQPASGGGFLERRPTGPNADRAASHDDPNHLPLIFLPAVAGW